MSSVIKKSKYRGVSKIKRKDRSDVWMARCKKNKIEQNQPCNSEREAAIAYDKMRIKNGMEPVNILKRK